MRFVVFTQKTAYEMRISDWSSDVCSSDLKLLGRAHDHFGRIAKPCILLRMPDQIIHDERQCRRHRVQPPQEHQRDQAEQFLFVQCLVADPRGQDVADQIISTGSEEHTSELQSLMRISYAVFCLKKKTIQKQHT